MKRNVIQGFVIVIFIVCCGLLAGNSILKKISRNHEPLDSLLDRRNLSFLRLSAPDLIEMNTIVALFHPSCDYCQKDAQEIFEARSSFKDFEVLWISYDEKSAISQFSKTYGLDSLENVHFAYMDIEVMLERYGNVKFPTFLAYDKNGTLLQKFVGVTKPEELLSVYASEK